MGTSGIVSLFVLLVGLLGRCVGNSLGCCMHRDVVYPLSFPLLPLSLDSNYRSTESRRLGEEDPCPPVDTVEGFNITVYASATWYVQEQAVTTYLPVSRNYCVTADYTILEKPTWPWRYTIQVDNKAQDEAGNPYGGIIYAGQEDPSSEDTAKLEVAPGFLPRTLAGPYWILAYEEGDNGYALISGGQPTVRTESGCQTMSNRITSSGGLWIFTRQATRNEELVARVRSMAAEDFGLDVTILNTVDQDSCDWPEHSKK